MVKAKSTRNDGSVLEKEASGLLRLVPGAAVSHQILLKGKKVDVLFELRGHILSDQRIAIECKDWHNPLTRRQSSEILSEYLPLIPDHTIDQFWLITRNGLVPNAKSLFDGRVHVHLTLGDLMRKLFNPLPLIHNMVEQFLADDLAQDYIPLKAAAPKLKLTHRNYDLIYNDFMELALTEGVGFNKALKLWEVYSGNDLFSPEAVYDERLFEELIHERSTPSIEALEEYIIKWLADAEVTSGLALLGSYGTGKSCFARRIAYSVGNRYREHDSGRVPFLIELKEFGAHQDIKGLITHELVNRHGIPNAGYELFRALNRAGFFFIILDGFDEMKQGMTTDSLLFNFHQIGSLLEGNAKVLLCGRPTLFESQSEQNRVLQGHFSQSQTSPAKFIQLKMEAFDVDEACLYLTRRSGRAKPEEKRRMTEFVSDLRKEAVSNADLRSLIARPVHLPMLAVVVPRTSLSATELKRSLLYREFINRIIEREMLKRRNEFQSNYPSESRFQFAKRLCVEMTKRGESRAMRYSEIPDDLFSGFLRPGVPIEAVKRDLVSACFLERKPPDILYVPHKSFLEFLVAEALLDAMRDKEVRTDSVGVLASEEIFSFLREMATEDDWMRVFDNASDNSILIGKLTHSYLKDNQVISARLEQSWLRVFPTFHRRIRNGIALYYESGAERLSDNGFAVLRLALKDVSYVAATHAYRALGKFHRSPSMAEMIQLVGAATLEEWINNKWVTWDETAIDRVRLSAVREKLLGILLGCSGRQLE